jgi:hypothetical protein
LIDFPAGLGQAGLLSVSLIEGLLLVVGAALVVFFLGGLPRKPAAPEHP